jgi:sugar/nucleoside kinase (ribokinase family)
VSLVIVGSVALDSIESPWGSTDAALGGSAIYGSLAARLFTDVSIVGVVGDDFDESHMKLLKERGIDTSGLQREKGATFVWKARYDRDPDVRETTCTELNVFERFDPELSDSQRRADTIFLANIDPVLQMKVLNQVEGRKVAFCDTMSFWIERKRAELDELFGKVDGVIINEEELLHYAGKTNLFEASESILRRGVKYLVVKKGISGSVLFSEDSLFFAPVFPVKIPKDPTGAGDSFAGGFLGYLDSSGHSLDNAALRRAVIVGTAVASFAVSDFGVAGLLSASKETVAERFNFIRSASSFGEFK